MEGEKNTSGDQDLTEARRRARIQRHADEYRALINTGKTETDDVRVTATVKNDKGKDKPVL